MTVIGNVGQQMPNLTFEGTLRLKAERPSTPR